MGKVNLQSIDSAEERKQAQDDISFARCSRSTERSVSKSARLLNLYQAATYTGLSYWTLRDWLADGILKVVKLPCGRQRIKGGAVVRKAGDATSRKILIDRQDLDNLIDRCKETM
jgi:hypothetical protein